MNILWHSTSPACNSGYGKVSRELLRRLKAAGHSLTIATKHPSFGSLQWEGIDVFNGQDIAYLIELMGQRDIDYVFTLWDIWVLSGKRHFPKDKWVAYVPTDTNDLSTVLAEVLADTGVQIAMSKHGLSSMRRGGFAPLYAPHGVDMATLYPDPEGRREFRESFGWGEDMFVIGTVGLNYRDDRKGFIPLMQAFKAFHARHPQSRLYIHTDAGLKGGDTIPFAKIATAFGIGEAVAWPHQMSYAMSMIGEDWLRSIYNGMDVFCLPTRGEGFGIPTIDAQACNVPVIVSDNTTGPELCRTGWLIEKDEDDLRWLPNGAWRYEPRASAVLAKLEEAYDAWRSPGWEAFKALARPGVAEYGWDVVWGKHFAPAFRLLEDMLTERKAKEAHAAKGQGRVPDGLSPVLGSGLEEAGQAGTGGGVGQDEVGQDH